MLSYVEVVQGLPLPFVRDIGILGFIIPDGMNRPLAELIIDFVNNHDIGVDFDQHGDGFKWTVLNPES